MEYSSLKSENNGKLLRHMRICVNSISPFRSTGMCDTLYGNFSNCANELWLDTAVK